MLWHKLTGNICYNHINITYYGDIDMIVKISNDIKDEFNGNKNIRMDFLEPDDFLPLKDLNFESSWVAPIEFLQGLCNKYNVDIIGVAYEFEDGYVEAFELYNQLISEDTLNHIISVISEETSEIETITELPKAQDDEILDKECPKSISDEDFELNCKTILE